MKKQYKTNDTNKRLMMRQKRKSGNKLINITNAKKVLPYQRPADWTVETGMRLKDNFYVLFSKHLLPTLNFLFFLFFHVTAKATEQR